MKQFIFLLLAFGIHFATAQDIYIDPKGTVSFFASTPLEDIDATSNQAISAININTKDVYFKVKMESFVFKRALMQEHFNENYAESEKFPNATFKGTLDQKDIDLTKDGTYTVSTTGDLTIHGVTQHRTMQGTLVVKGKSIDLTSTFDVKIADYGISIPTVVSQKIAEVAQVKVHSVLVPSEK